MALSMLTLRREPDMIDPQGAQTGSTAESAGLTLERYLTLAKFLIEHPSSYDTLMDVAQKLAVARDNRWTGKIEINLLTGEVMGGPTIKAV